MVFFFPFTGPETDRVISALWYMRAEAEFLGFAFLHTIWLPSRLNLIKGWDVFSALPGIIISAGRRVYRWGSLQRLGDRRDREELRREGAVHDAFGITSTDSRAGLPALPGECSPPGARGRSTVRPSGNSPTLSALQSHSASDRNSRLQGHSGDCREAGSVYRRETLSKWALINLRAGWAYRTRFHGWLFQLRLRSLSPSRSSRSWRFQFQSPIRFTSSTTSTSPRMIRRQRMWKERRSVASWASTTPSNTVASMQGDDITTTTRSEDIKAPTYRSRKPIVLHDGYQYLISPQKHSHRNRSETLC